VNAAKRPEKLRPGEVKVPAVYGRVTLRPEPADNRNPARCCMTTMPQNEFTLPQLRALIAALQQVAQDIEVQEVQES
jgi:hypothetical protein